MANDNILFPSRLNLIKNDSMQSENLLIYIFMHIFIHVRVIIFSNNSLPFYGNLNKLYNFLSYNLFNFQVIKCRRVNKR